MPLFESLLREYPRPFITNTELIPLLKGTANSRYSKIKRLLAQGKLLHIRRGLYCLTSKLGYFDKVHPFELAQHIYGPSFISLESALSFHKLIPETVYTITSVTLKRAKEFKTLLGVFSYLTLPLENFYTGVDLIKENGSSFFIAKPWRAICDYIYCYKKDWNTLEPLIKSLRMNDEYLPMLLDEEIQSLEEYYQNKRISYFLKSVRKELSDERIGYER